MPCRRSVSASRTLLQTTLSAGQAANPVLFYQVIPASPLVVEMGKCRHLSQTKTRLPFSLRAYHHADGGGGGGGGGDGGALVAVAAVVLALLLVTVAVVLLLVRLRKPPPLVVRSPLPAQGAPDG